MGNDKKGADMKNAERSGEAYDQYEVNTPGTMNKRADDKAPPPKTSDDRQPIAKDDEEE